MATPETGEMDDEVELKSLVLERLQQNGVLDQIKVSPSQGFFIRHRRSCVLLYCLHSMIDSCHRNPTGLRQVISAIHRLWFLEKMAAAAVLDFLRSHDMKATLSVFERETGSVGATRTP